MDISPIAVNPQVALLGTVDETEVLLDRKKRKPETAAYQDWLKINFADALVECEGEFVLNANLLWQNYDKHEQDVLRDYELMTGQSPWTSNQFRRWMLKVECRWYTPYGTTVGGYFHEEEYKQSERRQVYQNLADEIVANLLVEPKIQRLLNAQQPQRFASGSLDVIAANLVHQTASTGELPARTRMLDDTATLEDRKDRIAADNPHSTRLIENED